MAMMTDVHRCGSRPFAALRALPPSALFALVLLAGCRTGGGWTPAEPAAFERLPVQSSGRWGSTTELRFGDYRADSVKISWARGSGGGVQVGGLGTDRTESRQEYRFSLRPAHGAPIAVTCHSSTRERNVGLRSIEVRASARYTYDCDIRPAAGAPWRLALIEEGAAGFTGTLTADGEQRIAVHTHLGGKRLTGRRADAYELRIEENAMASVDPRSRVVWLARPASADERRDTAADQRRSIVAAAGVALLLYQRPTP